MAASTRRSRILVIGIDVILAYLLERYAEESGCSMLFQEFAPLISEIDDLRPAAIIFSSIERLQETQTLVEDLSTHDIPILVCGSVTDEVHARELGADACLLHPLTYDSFWAVLSAIFPARTELIRFSDKNIRFLDNHGVQ